MGEGDGRVEEGVRMGGWGRGVGGWGMGGGLCASANSRDADTVESIPHIQCSYELS